jgi:hypothetical protein
VTQHRTTVVLPSVALVVAVLASVALVSQARGASRPTAVRAVAPVDGAGNLAVGYAVTRNEGDGTCQPGSNMTGTAYRCSTPDAPQGVLDPCWQTASATTMDCLTAPWLHGVVQLRVTGSAAGPGFRNASLPWGMRIGPVRCLRDPGAVSRINGRLLLYHCTRHRDLYAPLRDHGSDWTAHLYLTDAHTRTGYRSLGWSAVDVAWYGVPTQSAQPSPSPSTSPTTTVTPTTTGSP